MIYVYLTAASILLFVTFVSLTLVEARTGMRVLGGLRNRLDRQAYRLFFIAKHVNWAEFLAHATRSAFERVLHDIAFASLALVRFIERQLTRIVRYLRDRRPNVLAPKPSREPIFSNALAYLRRRLRRAPTDEPKSTDE